MDLTLIVDCAQFFNLLSNILGNGYMSLSFKESKVILSWNPQKGIFSMAGPVVVHNRISTIIVTSLRGGY